MSKYVLDLPWGVRPPGVVYHKNISRWVYDASKAGSHILPKELRPYRAQPFSYEEWVQSDLFGVEDPRSTPKTPFSPHPHQLEAAEGIKGSYNTGKAGFLLADKTGLGKTISALYGVDMIASQEGFGSDTEQGKAKTLIVCPKGAIPQWRETILRSPITHNLHRILVINYQQLKKLVNASSNATARKSTKKRAPSDKVIARGAKPKINWDFVIFDEAHYLKNYPQSATSVFAEKIAKLDKPYRKGQSPFVLEVTATPGHSPLNLAVMSPWLAPLIDKTKGKGMTPAKWGEFLEACAFDVKKQKSGWVWAAVPWYGKNSADPRERAKYAAGEAIAKKNQRRDALRIGHALLSKEAPFLSRSPKDIAGWPEQNVIPLPLDLTVKQQPVYEEAWTSFRKFLRLPPAKQDPKSRLVETLRYRQKSSLLKVPHIADQVHDWVNNDKQVFISCEFIETIDKFAEEFQKLGISYTEMSGRTLGETREENRLKFQRGEASVVLCTIIEAISLHAGETLPDGSRATSNERMTIVCDIRQNEQATEQLLGRAHRDGQHSVAYIPYFSGTVDEQVIERYLNKSANAKLMRGASLQDATLLDRLFAIAAAK